MQFKFSANSIWISYSIALAMLVIAAILRLTVPRIPETYFWYRWQPLFFNKDGSSTNLIFGVNKDLFFWVFNGWWSVVSLLCAMFFLLHYTNGTVTFIAVAVFYFGGALEAMVDQALRWGVRWGVLRSIFVAAVVFTMMLKIVTIRVGRGWLFSLGIIPCG